MTLYIWLSLVTALAAALRLHRLDLIDFRFDQAYPLQYAMDITAGRLWGAQPHGSVGAHPAAYLYVMALPYLFTRNFMAVVGYRVLLDVVAVLACGLLGRRYFNDRVGFISALLFAASPWAIQFSRNLWPVTQPLFSLLLLVGLLEVSVRLNPWGWALTGWGVALVSGMHLSGVYVLPVMLIALLTGRRSFKLGPALLGALPVALVITGFVLHDAARNFESLRAYLSVSADGGRLSSTSLQFAAWLGSGMGLSSLTGQAFDEWTRETPTVLFAPEVVLVIWLALACAWVTFCVLRQLGSERARLIVLLWCMLPVALQAASSRPVMLQYLPFLLPAPFMVMAIAADDGLRVLPRLPENRGRLLRGVSFVSIVLLLALQVALTLHFTSFIERHATQGGYGLPVRAVLATRQMAVESLRNGEVRSEVILVTSDFPTPWNEQAAILRAVMADVPHRFMSAGDDGFVFRPDQTHYILAPGAEALLSRMTSVARPGTVVVRSVEPQPNSSAQYTYVLLREPIATHEFQADLQAAWESHVALAGYRIAYEPNRSELRIESILRVLNNSLDGADYHWFHHLFAGDEKIAQVDGQGVHPSAWREGDLIYQAFALRLPAQMMARSPVRLRIGSYHWPDVRNVPVRLSDGTLTDAVDIPLAFVLPTP